MKKLMDFGTPFLGTVFVLLLGLTPHASAQMGLVEHGVNRPGQDLDNFPSDSWIHCSGSCASLDKCWAYTYVKPQGQAKRGTCWIKDKAPKPRPDNCCVSGVKVMGPYELGIDRPGRNLRDGFAMTQPGSCRRECQQDPECWSWTWVKPGIQGEEGRCWLKDGTPEAKANSCCVSGIRVVAPPSSPQRTSTRPSRAAAKPKRAAPKPKRAAPKPTRTAPQPTRAAPQPTRTAPRPTRTAPRPRNDLSFTVAEKGPPRTVGVHQIIEQCRGKEVFVRKDDCRGRSLAHVAASSAGAVSLQFHADPGQRVVLCCDNEMIGLQIVP